MNALIRALTRSGGVSKLLPLRREITKLDHVEPHFGKPLLTTMQRQIKDPVTKDIVWIDPELPPGHIQSGFVGAGSPGINYSARAVGGIPYGEADEAARLADARGTLRSFGAYSSDSGTHGLYNPNAKTMMNFDDDPDVTRHELIHGLRHIAAIRGETSALPLPLRAAAAMRSSSIPPVKAAGGLFEEAIARGVGGESPLDFLLSGNRGYAKQARQISPLVAALFESGPQLGTAAKYGGAAGAGLGLGYALSDT